MHIESIDRSATRSRPGSTSLRGLRPAAELAQGRPHGDRLRYVAGCRCDECRRANTTYARTRAAAQKQGDWNGLVAASRTREHLVQLSAMGVGYKTAADAASVAVSVVAGVLAGSRLHVRARTERAILAVTAATAADHALVDAGPTWQLLAELLADGYSKASLARELGCTRAALQISRTQVTVKNAAKVRRLHERLRLVDAQPTLALLEDLSQEGFHRVRVARAVADMAAAAGLQAPLDVLGDRIRRTTALVVERLHFQLTQ